MAHAYVYSRARGAWTAKPRRVEWRHFVAYLSTPTHTLRFSDGVERTFLVTEPVSLTAQQLAEALASLKEQE